MVNLRLKTFLLLVFIFLSKLCFCQEGNECTTANDCDPIECKIAECKENNCHYDQNAPSTTICDDGCKKCDGNGECNVPLHEVICGEGGCKVCFDGSCINKEEHEHCDPYDGCTECDELGTCVDKIGTGCFCNDDEDCRDAAGGTVDSCKFWQAAAAMGKCVSYPTSPCTDHNDCAVNDICIQYRCEGEQCVYSGRENCCNGNEDCTFNDNCSEGTCNLEKGIQDTDTGTIYYNCEYTPIPNCCENDLDCGNPTNPIPCHNWGCSENYECTNIPKPECCANDNDCSEPTRFCDIPQSENEGTCKCNNCETPPPTNTCENDDDCTSNVGFCAAGTCNDNKECIYKKREQELPCCEDNSDCHECSTCFYDEEKKEQYCIAKPCNSDEECGSCLCVNDKCQNQGEENWTDSFKGTREYFTKCSCRNCCFPKRNCIDHLQWNVPEDVAIDYFVLENIDNQDNPLFSEIIEPPFESPVTFDTSSTKCKKLPKTYKLKYVSGGFNSVWEATVVEDEIW